MGAPTTVGRFFLLVGVSALLFVAWRTLTRTPDQRTPNKDSDVHKRNTEIEEAMFKWKAADPFELEVPTQVTNDAKGVGIKHATVNVMGIDTFYLEAPGNPDSISVLLLHGAAFSSKTWRDLGTIQLTSAAGHRTIAVDLPGYGKTPGPLRQEKPSFLSDLVSKLGLCQGPGYILISPSMSGGYSVPFVLSAPDCPPKGYIPVAPVGTDSLPDGVQNVRTPTLIVYGSRDKGLGHRSRDSLSVLPNSRAVEIEDAGHPAYLDQPERWHRLLYTFLAHIKS